MATFTTSNTFTEMSPNPGYKELVVITPSSAIASDVVEITMSDHGFSTSGLLTVTGYRHTTANSVVVSDDPTTQVYTDTLSLTMATALPTSWTRVYRIVGKSA